MMSLYLAGDLSRDIPPTTYNRRNIDSALVLWDALAPWLGSEAADDLEDQSDVIVALRDLQGVDLLAQMLTEYGKRPDMSDVVAAMRDPRAAWLTIDSAYIARRAVRVEGVPSC